MHFLTPFLIALIAAAVPDAARAQDTAPGDKAAQVRIDPLILDNGPVEAAPDDDMEAPLDMLAKLPPPVQKEIMDESNRAFQHCHDNLLLSSLYDCSCFALNFMGRRINAGPDKSYTDLVMNNNFKSCLSEPQTFGYAYDRCYRISMMEKVTDQSLDEMCKCTGKKLHAALKANPVMDSSKLNYLFSDVLRQCRREHSFR